MTKYTVTLTQAHMRYTQAVAEVDAEDSNDAAEKAKAMVTLSWQPTDGEDTGHLDISVESEAGGCEDWRED